MKTLKIGFFGDGEWSHNSLKSLISDKTLQIMFVVPRYDDPDDVLVNISKKNFITVLSAKNINDSDFLKTIRKFECDVLISMSYNQIFKKDIINLPKYGILNCHAGKLPYYRGRNILNWALINDEKEFGITVHFVDEGIDTGDIILQECFAICDNDNYKSLLEIAFINCPKILHRSIKMIQSNSFERIMQNEIDQFGSFCGRRLVGDEIIEWNNQSRDVFNFIRAISSPGPNARSFINDKEIQIRSSKFLKDAPKYKGIPGQVLSINEKGFYVKTLDSYIFVDDFIFSGKIRVGNRLKSNK